MSDTSQNNKRIAKNTLLLYFRMLFMMAVNLYTSRVVLHVLGIEDFGIYNVVGGVVAMFSVISGSLSAAISRFITYELGKGDKDKLIRIFSSSVTIQLGLGLIILILAEIIGVWFLNVKMSIPENRMYAANWVFQLSILTFIINLISVPYNAAIIAHEKMSAFAYISILEVVAKLIIVYMLLLSPIDKLIFYAILMASVALIIRFVYGFYCKRNFEECTYHFILDKELLKKMFGFAGWNFIGTSAGVLRTQGINILLNIYFDPIVNAARGVAVQVNNAVSSFSTNFLMAVNPQIIKSYSKQDIERAYMLAMCGARFSFLLLSAISLPIICETDYILKLWLKIVPDYSVTFVRLTLILTIIEVVSLPLVTLQQATGKIRNYQIVVGTLHMVNFPVSFVFLHFGFKPEVVYFVAISLAVISLYARLYMLKRVVDISIMKFNEEVVIRVVLVALFMFLSLFVVEKYTHESFFGIILSLLIAMILSILIGLKKQEIIYVYSKIIKKR